MKTETYDALSKLNTAFEQVADSLKKLRESGVLAEQYVQDKTVLSEELRAGINHMIVDKLQTRETEDWAHFGRMRATIEARLKQ